MGLAEANGFGTGDRAPREDPSLWGFGTPSPVFGKGSGLLSADRQGTQRSNELCP